MVYNISKMAKLPFSNATLHPHNGRVKVKGNGCGSVLLSKGGPGAGSSYSNIDEYISTTGINPYAKNSKPSKLTGKGLESLSSKLQKLTPGVKVKRKNITMSF